MNKLINEVLEIYEEADAVGIAYNLKKGLSAYFVHDYECIPTKYRICITSGIKSDVVKRRGE